MIKRFGVSLNLFVMLQKYDEYDNCITFIIIKDKMLQFSVINDIITIE